jgi:signal transduction histidine kinase
MFAISRITLKQELTEVPPVKGDAEELQEVFINLIQNAIEAMPEGGTLTLRSYNEEGKVVTEVSDTGKGIPEQIRQLIFDPFFSTRHEGVGLGLSIVYRIIREHGAEIKVASEVGKGTTFRIIF